jgi:tetratricopeptide (TPR) repeat protein
MNFTRLEQLQNMLQASPGDAFLVFAIAKEYEKNGALQDALLHYERLAEKDPEYVGLYYHYGKLLERLNKMDEALSVYKKGVDTALRAGDRHAAAELQGALMEIEE